VLREDGTLAATTWFDGQPGIGRRDAAENSKSYIRRHWTYREPRYASDGLLERVQSHTLCISGMAFQDAWNIDLQRLKRCCIHVAAGQNKMIPFCAYYLTDTRGRRLVDQHCGHPGDG
jgi:hypothetical protein